MFSELIGMNSIDEIASKIKLESSVASFHAIKSTALNLGFNRLADFAGKLEKFKNQNPSQENLKTITKIVIDLNKASTEEAHKVLEI